MITIDLAGARAYLLDRAREASTWRGAILLLTSSGVAIKPELHELIVGAGLGAAGLVAVLFPDAKRPPQ